MTKVKKMIAAIVLLILLMLLWTAMIFPGLYWYQKVKNHYSLDESVQEMTVPAEQIPEEWRSYEQNGIAFQAPPELKIGDNHADMKISVYAHDRIDTRETGLYPVTEEEIQKFCQDIGKPYPETEYEVYDILLNLKRSDCNLRNWYSAKAFAHFANLKAVQYLFMPEVFHISGGGWQGFLYQMKLTEGSETSMFLIFPENQPYSRVEIIFTGEEGRFRQILGSIEISE